RPPTGATGGRLLASPLARRIAEQHGIDPASITGTGPGGRIVRADVEAAVAAQADTAPQQPAGKTAASNTSTDETESVEVPLTMMRKVMAERLTESAGAPHFYLTNVVAVDRLFALRAEINERFADTGTRISVTDLLVKACALTLEDHPQVNASWAGDKILQHPRAHIGVAVALDDGLIVPVVRNAATKGLDVISTETRALATKARDGKLAPAEFSGGTFSISNLGMFGIDNFTAVINPPEAAILAVGATTEEPYVQDGKLSSRRIMKITLTSDHRVLDGAVSAAFLRDLKRTLEEPLRIII
ncbi:MAG: 2-oxo acid dehydrogenase subunit E2, partial [Micrococcaceae bacterium]|nr:2-oxo acid dehydrogenase subunit E2 [Micrococcaceae bacterium]